MRTVKVIRQYVESVDDPDLADFGVYPVTVPDRAQVLQVDSTGPNRGVVVTFTLEP